MIRRLLCGLILCLFILPLSAQDTDDTRILSISVLPPLDPPLSEDDFVQAYIGAVALSYEAGARGSLVTEVWSKLEPSTGTFVLDDITSVTSYLTQYYDQTLMVGIQVINTTVKETPADLQEVPFDSPQMIARFKALIDALAPHLGPNVRYLSIGNEVDAYLSSHPDEWDSYTRFYTEVAVYVRKVLPHVQVGVTVTYGGTQADPDEVARLTASSDVFILTYYPLNPDFTPQAPDSALTDIPRMIEMAGDKPLLLQEVGYPSGEGLGSSEIKQAEFFEAVFEAWEEAGENIPFLNVFAMGDFSDQMCADFLLYYQLPNSQTFYDYLCTLGLQQVDGTPKAAWQVFIEEGVQIANQANSESAP